MSDNYKRYRTDQDRKILGWHWITPSEPLRERRSNKKEKYDSEWQ
jgi:hypothetical protein